MYLALNNLQMLICHKTPSNHPTNQPIHDSLLVSLWNFQPTLIYIYIYIYICETKLNSCIGHINSTEFIYFLPRVVTLSKSVWLFTHNWRECWFMPFSSALAHSGKLKASSRIWNGVSDSIFYDDKPYNKYSSIYLIPAPFV